MMLNFIYASFHCSEKMFERVFKDSKQKPGQAVQKYNRLLAEGLARQKDSSVTVVCEMPITENSYSKKIFRRSEEYDNGVHYIYIPLVNKHRIKDMLAVVTSYFLCIPLFIKKKNTVAVADILNAPVALGTYLAAALLKKKYVAVITDAPQFVYFDSDKAYRLVSNFLIRRASGYVFLTQQMNELFNKKNKPYTIIEGLADHRTCEDTVYGKADAGDKTICMYTGSIHEIYGIGNLISGFIEADMSGAELHIYGEGDYKECLLKICEKYGNIKYFGNLLSWEIVQKQRKAALLINPRPTGGEFTKYSFPSKTIEYMASGTPVLTTRLPGIPKEYDRYLYFIEEDSAEGIKEALQSILGRSREELSLKGMEAKQFVLNEKNNIVQSEKLLHLFDIAD